MSSMYEGWILCDSLSNISEALVNGQPVPTADTVEWDLGLLIESDG